MTNRANAFRAEHAIRDGDLVKLKLEVGRNAARTSSSLQPGFLSVSAFAEVGSAADEGDSGSSSGTSTFSQPSTSPPIESYIIELMAGELIGG